jgi:hypothetical protein
VVETSLGLAVDQVILQQRYRCGTTATLTTQPNSCAHGVQQYEYVHLQLTDTIEPAWVKFGMGSPFEFTVTRTIQIK